MNKNIEELYRKYLLDFLKNSFDQFIETEVLSFEEFQEKIKEEKL